MGTARPPTTSGAIPRVELFVLPQVMGRANPDARTEVRNLPKKDPWHSIKQSVHHNNTACNTGNNIERENLRQGTGGKPLCRECADLNAQGR